MKKKRNGWKIAFIILLLLIVLFFVWLFSDDEEYDDYDDYSDHSTYSTYSPGNTSTTDNQEPSDDQPLFSNDVAVRDKLVTLKGNGKDTVTVLIYMNGSDLESEDNEATTDLSEIVAAGSPDKVNVLVETLGTKRWNGKYGISSKTAQRYSVSGSGLTLVQDKLGNVNCGDPSGLTDFIKWGAKNYPADRYILMFWDHGGGPVYGFGYDDRTESDDSLTIAEMQKAIRDAGVTFDFIGMDCCIMSGIEVCSALYDYCDYMILSEDFESGKGWYYTSWFKALYENTSISTPELGRIIVDGMVSANSKSGDDAILAVIDERYVKVLYSSWLDFAYSNENELLGKNYSRKKNRKPGYRVSPVLEKNGYFRAAGRGIFDFIFGDDDDADFSEYYITDLMAVADNIKQDESKVLSAALDKALVYINSCGSSSVLTGISVTLPYGDAEFYDEMKDVFLDCGFSESYVDWLGEFASSGSTDDYYDYSFWDDLWNGWDDWEDDNDWDEDDWDDDDWDDWFWDDEFWDEWGF